MLACTEQNCALRYCINAVREMKALNIHMKGIFGARNLSATAVK
jgi:hypothetical protein